MPIRTESNKCRVLRCSMGMFTEIAPLKVLSVAQPADI